MKTIVLRPWDSESTYDKVTLVVPDEVFTNPRLGGVYEVQVIALENPSVETYQGPIEVD